MKEQIYPTEVFEWIVTIRALGSLEKGSEYFGEWVVLQLCAQ